MYRKNKGTSETIVVDEEGKITVLLSEEGKTDMRIDESIEGEYIEQKVERIMNNDEPIEDGAPQIFTERKDGVIPEYNIRTDRFEEAIDMTNRIADINTGKRANAIEERKKALEGLKNDGKPESTQGQVGNNQTTE